MTDFVVVGFPKCGTSALMRLLQRMPGLVVERHAGELEAPFYMSDESADAHEAEIRREGEKIYGHKFVSYIYSAPALERIARRNPAAVFVVCVRDPEKALASWREMHRQIAASEDDGAGHFIQRDPGLRRFYAEASLEEYYEEFARHRLRYAALIRRLMAFTTGHRVVVVEQSALASDPDRVLATLAGEFGLPTEAAAASGVLPARRAHIGVGDRSSVVSHSAMRQELAAERHQLAELLAELERDGQARVVRPRTPDERAAIRQQIPRSVAVLGTTNGVDPSGYLAALKGHPLVADVSNLSMAASPSMFLHYRLASVSEGMHDLCLIETLACDTSALRAKALDAKRVGSALEAAVLGARERGMLVAGLLIPTRRRDAFSEHAHREHATTLDQLGVPYCNVQSLVLELSRRSGREWDSLFRDAGHLQAPLARAMLDGFLADLMNGRLATRPAPGDNGAIRYRWWPVSDEDRATLASGRTLQVGCEPGEALEALVLNARATQCLLKIDGEQGLHKDLRFKPGTERKLATVACVSPVREVGGAIGLSLASTAEGPIEPSYLADPAVPASGALDLVGVLLSRPGLPGQTPRPDPVSCAWQPGADQWQAMLDVAGNLALPVVTP